MDIRTRLITFHTSKNGSVKFKTIPTELYDDIINATSDYESYHDGHVKIRAWMLVNNRDVPHCENCNSPFYPTRTDQFGVKRFCSFQCAGKDDTTRKKIRNTCLKKYGVEHPMMVEDIKEKLKSSINDKYGVDHVFQLDEFRNNTKALMREKYGVDCYTQSDEFKKKSKATIKSKHGVECYSQTDVFKEKVKQSNLSKYGVANYAQTEECRRKMKNTNLERYGVDSYSKTAEFKETLRNRCMEDNGVANFSQVRYSDLAVSILLCPDEMKRFMKDKTTKQAANMLDINITTVYNYMRTYGISDYNYRESNLEIEMNEMLDLTGLPYRRNVRDVITPYELDFFIPTAKIAIEMNGDYWHSEERGKGRVYHHNKWKLCVDAGIRLIQITETDWINNTECVRNLIRSSLGLKVKGDPARKCTVREISAKEARPFVDQYHLQGFASGTSYLGAYDTSGELCGVMIFGWTRGSKSARRFELKRWVMDNKSHAGLFSKVFKYSQRQLEFNEVVSFSMNDWFTGDVYEKAGFVYDGMLDPDYRYHYSRRLVHKSSFRKSEICKKFPELSEEIKNGMTEKEAMESLGIPRVWDSGKKIWLWKKHQDDE